jgi:hypothetical protein
MFKQLHFNVLRDGYQYRSVVIEANMVIIWDNYICKRADFCRFLSVFISVDFSVLISVDCELHLCLQGELRGCSATLLADLMGV